MTSASTPIAPRSRASLSWLVFSVVAVITAASVFYIPGLGRTHGLWPAPLDDVYIHFDFARSAAQGHPFEWMPGNGYSSGGTSLIYPLLLAPGWWLGLRGSNLGVFAALLACAALVDFARSLRALTLAIAPRWIDWCAPILLVAVPLLDWSWFSGMEAALLGAVLGRALVAANRASTASAPSRKHAQLVAGLWCAMLVATRPETAPLGILLALSVAYAAGSLRTSGSLARAIVPLLGLLAAQAAANRAFTGEWSAAGAVRKLVFTNPYATSQAIAVEVVKNLSALRAQAFDAALGGAPWSSALPLLALVSALDRRTRRIGLPLVLGALGALALVSLNATARFQNLRYAAPTLMMLLAAALLGAGALAKRNAVGGAVAAALLAVLVIAPARWFPRQIDHFARASQNIADQQIEVAHRLLALSPPPRRVFVGDAGAIPYFSGLPALDGLGLGGFHDLPFARASVHGVPAVIELIERLAPADRPDVLAIYPSWWQGLAGDFGRRIDAVKITDNVICAADEKVVYAADWSTLAPPDEHRDDAVDEIDVADLVDERSHRYTLPGPSSGYAIGATLLDASGARRWDAGRIVPEGRVEGFTVSASVARGPGLLALRTDGGDPVSLSIEQLRSGKPVSRASIDIPRRSGPSWFEAKAALDAIEGGDAIRVVVVRGSWRSFHVWLLRSKAPASATRETP